MKRLALGLAAAVALAAPLATPAAAQTLTVLLPVISFPDTIITPSTMGCGQPTPEVCELKE